jgi:hypothetical protein
MRKKFGVLPAFGSQFLCEKEWKTWYCLVLPQTKLYEGSQHKNENASFSMFCFCFMFGVCSMKVKKYSKKEEDSSIASPNMFSQYNIFHSNKKHIQSIKESHILIL